MVPEAKHLIHECMTEYSFETEDKRDFGPYWDNGTHTNALPEFKYRTPEELDGWPYWAVHGLYSGGGYKVQNLTHRKYPHTRHNPLLA